MPKKISPAAGGGAPTLAGGALGVRKAGPLNIGMGCCILLNLMNLVHVGYG